MAQTTVVTTVTSYETNKKGDIINTSAKSLTSLKEGIECKKNDNDVMVFVTLDSSLLENVQSKLNDKGMQLYKTKNVNSYILGSQRRPIVEASLDI